MTPADLAVATLGPCRIDSPLRPLIEARKTTEHYVDESDRILFHDTLGDVSPAGLTPAELPGFEPRPGRDDASSSTRRSCGSAS